MKEKELRNVIKEYTRTLFNEINIDRSLNKINSVLKKVYDVNNPIEKIKKTRKRYKNKMHVGYKLEVNKNDYEQLSLKNQMKVIDKIKNILNDEYECFYSRKEQAFYILEKLDKIENKNCVKEEEEKEKLKTVNIRQKTILDMLSKEFNDMSNKQLFNDFKEELEMSTEEALHYLTQRSYIMSLESPTVDDLKPFMSESVTTSAVPGYMSKYAFKRKKKNTLTESINSDDKTLINVWFSNAFNKVPDENDDYYMEWLNRYENKGLVSFLSHMDSERYKAFIDLIKNRKAIESI